MSDDLLFGECRDCSYFDRIGKNASILELAEHERNGTLFEFISDVAPDYIMKGKVSKFKLCIDAGLF